MRARGRDLGHIHFNTSVIMKDADSVSEKLAMKYEWPALPPASAWLGAKKPGRPGVKFARDRATNELIVSLTPAANEKAWLWTVRSLVGGTWSSEVLPGSTRVHSLATVPDRVLVTAVSRTGVESEAVAIKPYKPSFSSVVVLTACPIADCDRSRLYGDCVKTPYGACRIGKLGDGFGSIWPRSAWR